tara:strand:+ start:373 stop:528 length:156 start_codon:yes stop_codon:yes gene_type:complete
MKISYGTDPKNFNSSSIKSISYQMIQKIFKKPAKLQNKIYLALKTTFACIF